MTLVVSINFKHDKVVKLFPSEQVLNFFSMLQMALVLFIFFSKGNFLIESHHFFSIHKLVLSLGVFQKLLLIYVLVLKILLVLCILLFLFSCLHDLFPTLFGFGLELLAMVEEILELFLKEQFVSVADVFVFGIHRYSFGWFWEYLIYKLSRDDAQLLWLCELLAFQLN